MWTACSSWLLILVIDFFCLLFLWFSVAVTASVPLFCHQDAAAVSSTVRPVILFEPATINSIGGCVVVWPKWPEAPAAKFLLVRRGRATNQTGLSSSGLPRWWWLLGIKLCRSSTHPLSYSRWHQSTKTSLPTPTVMVSWAATRESAEAC